MENGKCIVQSRSSGRWASAPQVAQGCAASGAGLRRLRVGGGRLFVEVARRAVEHPGAHGDLHEAVRRGGAEVPHVGGPGGVLLGAQVEVARPVLPRDAGREVGGVHRRSGVERVLAHDRLHQERPVLHAVVVHRGRRVRVGVRRRRVDDHQGGRSGIEVRLHQERQLRVSPDHHDGRCAVEVVRRRVGERRGGCRVHFEDEGSCRSQVDDDGGHAVVREGGHLRVRVGGADVGDGVRVDEGDRRVVGDGRGGGEAGGRQQRDGCQGEQSSSHHGVLRSVVLNGSENGNAGDRLQAALLTLSRHLSSFLQLAESRI